MQAASKQFTFSRPPELGRAVAKMHPVVIAGAGPVGLTLALTLARHGVPCVLLESEGQVCVGSRALGMSRRTLEIWSALDAAKAIAMNGVVWDGGTSFWRDREVLRFRMADDPRMRHRPMLNIQQCHTEAYLVDAALAHEEIDLRWQQRVKAVRTRDGSVDMEVETPEGDYLLHARHLVACDGARSTVRESMGLRLDGSTHEAAYLIADIQLETEMPMGRRCWFDPPSNPGSTVLMHGQPDGVWRLDYQLQPGESQEEAQQAGRVEERVAEHLAFIGERGPWKLLWTSVYRAHSRSLASFRQGNVFFAGDAAHLMPIFGIRGINSGVEDAWNLGWKLAMVHRGLSGDAVLDSYSVERRNAFLENAALADRNARFMTPPNEGARFVRDAVLQLSLSQPAMGDIINPRQASYVPLRDSPLSTTSASGDGFGRGPSPGEIVPDLKLPAQDGWLQARLGPWFTALVFGHEAELGAAALQELQRLSDTPALKVLRFIRRALPMLEADVIVDPLGELYAEFGAHAGTVYLVRPDQNVAGRWRALDAAAVDVAIARACGSELGAATARALFTVDLAPAERVYRAISEVGVASDAQANAQVFAKLAMALALELEDPAKVRQVIEKAGLQSALNSER